MNDLTDEQYNELLEEFMRSDKDAWDDFMYWFVDQKECLDYFKYWINNNKQQTERFEQFIHTELDRSYNE